jgi:hypothetical protein
MSWICGALTLTLTGPAPASADVWAADDPGRTSSGDLEPHTSESESPDDRTVESRDLSDATTGDPEARMREATAGEPEPARTDVSGPAARETSADDLSALDVRGPHEGWADFEVPDPATWRPTDDPAVRAARADVRAAIERARAAVARYAEMRDRNHPRGDPRLAIVAERDAALEALREAVQALDAAETAPPARTR